MMELKIIPGGICKRAKENCSHRKRQEQISYANLSLNGMKRIPDKQVGTCRTNSLVHAVHEQLGERLRHNDFQWPPLSSFCYACQLAGKINVPSSLDAYAFLSLVYSFVLFFFFLPNTFSVSHLILICLTLSLIRASSDFALFTR